jgi:mannose-6-phosphate isomerase-like protein (cupin superfamily)
MQANDAGRILDFAPIGMWWEITKSTADTGGEAFEAINVIGPGFGGPPLHLHPTAEESYRVLSGTLDVCVGREWRKVQPGETATVPAGVPHTLKNASGAEVRLVNVHSPALDFERFFRRMHALICTQGMKLPPKDLRSAILVSMLFTDHPREIVSVAPPRQLLLALSMVGRLVGYKLPSPERNPAT